MNIDLENGICPVCKAKLFTDEVAICPECGAPHHKKCFNSLGHCFYADSHGTNEQWQPAKVPYPDEKQENENLLKCKNCGYLNDVNDEACKKCGAVLKEPKEQEQKSTTENPFFKVNGIDPNEDLGGISAKEAASFVGYNALRYLRIFKRMKNTKSKVSWNWLGFFLTEYWYISRRMYAPAILKSLLSSLGSICLYFTNANTNSPETFFDDFMSANPVLIRWFFIFTVLSFLFSIITGIFGDYFYKNHVISKVKTLKENGNPTDIEFMRAGGANIFLPVILYFGTRIFETLLILFLRIL